MTMQLMKEQIKRLIAEHNLERVSKRIEELLVPAIHISKLNRGTGSIGTSRIGGLPDVPQDFEYPYCQGHPLGFLAQINCSDLINYDVGSALPHRGMLYFFYDMVEKPWGYDPKHRGGSAVVHIPAATSETLSRYELPLGSNIEELCLQEYNIGFKVIPSLPSHYASTIFDQEDFNPEEIDNYFNLLNDLKQECVQDEPLHQLLGHSNNLQGDMQIECQLVFHGLYCGNSSGYQDPRAKVLKIDASEWRLLLQIDSDDDIGAMWGDVGLIFFWIRKFDLKERQFSKTWTILQCG
ncbi:MAG: DUF1963 domain-containing protein [Leptolyngbya sp. UWPOB_LEPTO1]|uniref:YwqG family protein n=1 Tax=Leptolyngbya sp. UWPOB_LEPTO1 TaxID=2815653 RepID=UPI001AD17E6C|nr:YwqG family protein [Leptolyngbya sp. UWPOB_LEPTO1]MBN8562096.1 DUF1963 domain-containing protein [Leptolyngbya sp. UWPOB_LEPTO1]